MSGFFLPIEPFPFRTDRDLKRIPYVTYTIITICVLVWLFGKVIGLEQAIAIQDQWGFVINRPSFLTVITHMFLHDPESIFHLAGNMFLLWLCGRILEDAIGSLQFGLVYFASGLLAVILFGLIAKIFMPNSLDIPLVGASGAISGIMGLTCFRNYRMQVRTVPIVVFCLPIPLWFFNFWMPFYAYGVYFVATNIVDGIGYIIVPDQGNSTAHWAHIGGFALGVLVAYLLRSVEEGKREYALEDAQEAAIGTRSTYETLQELEQLIMANPQDGELLEAMAKLLIAKDKMDSALTFYRRAIKASLQKGHLDRAVSAFLDVKMIFPMAVFDSRDQFRIAHALEKTERIEEAAEAYLFIPNNYPTSDEAPNALMRAGLLYQRMGQPETTRDMLASLIEDYPHSHLIITAKQHLANLNLPQIN